MFRSTPPREGRPYPLPGYGRSDERIELRADRRPRPDIHRIAQHLPDRARVDPKTTSRFALAQTLNHYRVANPPIQFHSLHPPPFAPKCKGLSLTEFCSGATRLSGRFSEGLLLRRSQSLLSPVSRFDPRPHARGDLRGRFLTSTARCFDPRPHARGDLDFPAGVHLHHRFDPRPHARGDPHPLSTTM